LLTSATRTLWSKPQPLKTGQLKDKDRTHSVFG